MAVVCGPVDGHPPDACEVTLSIVYWNPLCAPMISLPLTISGPMLEVTGDLTMFESVRRLANR